MINTVIEEISTINPYDDLEHKHIQETLVWIQSGAPIYRTGKPDIPNKHLVSYFLLLDTLQQKLLLVDHKLAELWLPAGGHVEPDEHPRTTVLRECEEELGIRADFLQKEPLFLTSTLIPEGNNHTDVNLWYILKNSENEVIQFDPREFNSIQWFRFDEIPFKNSDPHMERFVNKLRTYYKELQ